jgi:hypothetical protein
MRFHYFKEGGIMSAQFDNEVTVTDSQGNTTIRLDGDNGRITSRSLQLRSAGGSNTIFLGGEDSTMLLGNTLRLDGDNGRITSRSLQLRSTGGSNTIFLGGEDSTMLLGTTIRLDGQSGDIRLSGADCAEDFAVAESVTVEPGTVMIAADEDLLEPCSMAYDKRVAGVVSGAGDLRPGILLGKSRNYQNGAPVALIGKVYCKVDADYDAIKVGDLITTSPTLGYAMKATDSARAFGAVLGKALRSLSAGRDLIPVLVCLQ